MTYELFGLGIDIALPSEELGELLEGLVSTKTITLESAFLILDYKENLDSTTDQA